MASIFILDLQSGEEVRIEAGAAMSGIDLVKLPIAVEAFRTLESSPSISQTQYLNETLTSMEETAPSGCWTWWPDRTILSWGGHCNRVAVAAGLAQYLHCHPYDMQNRPGLSTYETPANSLEVKLTSPDPGMQTTAEDMGTLLAMIYYCAQQNGGALRAAYPDQITQVECQELQTIMESNKIGSLIEEGVPPDVPVAHRHGWVGDTHGDAGIIFSPGGDYVLVMMFYKPEWLPWEVSSPLMAQISQATYNYFNFADPYLGGSRPIETTFFG